MPLPIRTIAFYLPQFHPTPENDAWWGKGFTEWTNVTRAQPLFPGHYQPHLPADLGFYDLRLPEVRQAQADLAQEYGIHGFCYYHYWFDGKRLLNRPLDEVLASGKPDFPFCLCWANESWTRSWDGKTDILIRQEYSPQDDIAHMNWLTQVFEDKRYIRFEGKPVFLVYRALHMPDPLGTAERWRETAHNMGIGDIFLCRVESHPDEHADPKSIGFDAAVEFQPDWGCLPPPLYRNRVSRYASRVGLLSRAFQYHNVYDYSSVVDLALQKPVPDYKRFPCVTPSWDNSARRKTGAAIFKDGSPQLYEGWLRAVVRRERDRGVEAGIIFVNAWNEWAEGNHLEPDMRFGHGYLEATHRALTTA